MVIQKHIKIHIFNDIKDKKFYILIALAIKSQKHLNTTLEQAKIVLSKVEVRFGLGTHVEFKQQEGELVKPYG